MGARLRSQTVADCLGGNYQDWYCYDWVSQWVDPLLLLKELWQPHCNRCQGLLLRGMLFCAFVYILHRKSNILMKYNQRNNASYNRNRKLLHILPETWTQNDTLFEKEYFYKKKTKELALPFKQSILILQ